MESTSPLPTVPAMGGHAVPLTPLPTVPANVPKDQILSVVEKGSDYVVSQLDVVVDKVVAVAEPTVKKTLKALLKKGLKALLDAAIGCLKKKVSPPAAPAPSPSSAPESDEPPPLEPSPDAV